MPRQLTLAAAIAAGFAGGYAYNGQTQETVQIVDVASDAVELDTADAGAVRTLVAAAGRGSKDRWRCYDYRGTVRCTDVDWGGSGDFEAPSGVDAGYLSVAEDAVYHSDDGARGQGGAGGGGRGAGGGGR